MSDYDYLLASDGTGDAALMHITAARTVGATGITVDTVSGVPAKFIATAGALLPTGLLNPATITNFKGHVSSGALQIDGFEPGSTDIGNTIGQVVVIKPTTNWANRIANFIKNATGTGTPEPLTPSTVTTTGAVTAGGLLTADAGLTVAAGAVGFPVGSTSSTVLTNPYKFRAHRSAAYTLVSSAFTKFPMEVEDFDTSSSYDNTTNYRFTAPINGYYQVSGRVDAGAVSGNRILACLYKNGTIYSRGSDNTVSSTLPAASNIADVIKLSAGDYIEMWYYSGNAVTTETGNDTNFFSAYLVSAT